MSGCKCNDPRVWEYGMCDYCSQDEWCGDCLHDIDECPNDCYCDCNENTDPESEE